MYQQSFKEQSDKQLAREEGVHWKKSRKAGAWKVTEGLGFVHAAAQSCQLCKGDFPIT